MAHPYLESTGSSSTAESFKDCFNLRLEGGDPTDVIPVLEASTSGNQSDKIPKPPALPGTTLSRGKLTKRVQNSNYVPKETINAWDKLFKEGYEADVQIFTEDQTIVRAHSCVLGVSSHVLRSLLKQTKVKDGVRCIKILGVPSKSVHAFVRFLYSSCYEEDAMKKCVLHLLVLSHSLSVPSLKRICISILEKGWLTTENVIDVLQLARQCDAPRLSLTCIQMIVKDLKKISSTEGWKVMKRVDPGLEQELVELVVEADSRNQEKMKKMEEKKMYLQLHEAMDALVHICRDGCRTIGPRDKVLKGSQINCGFPACKGLEMLVRHFWICKIRVPGGCGHCKRMWQLLELHSRMCHEPDSCKVPLCRHFKEKMQNQSKKDDTKWKLLVDKVMAATNASRLRSSILGATNIITTQEKCSLLIGSVSTT